VPSPSKTKDNISEAKFKKRKKLKHYNIYYHAHELTFSCYHRYKYLNDPVLCDIFIEALALAKERFKFKIWAFVLMPNHVHLLMYPVYEKYDISIILKYIKGKSSFSYRRYILDQSLNRFDMFCVISKGKKVFRIWQPGGGFDRNLWTAKAIHYSIRYIEGNPVRAELVENPENWLWSSSNEKFTKSG